ncbi:MAG: PadR family transcriptional regulator [Lentisphaerae bacterium]|nr:PadR family transcriptional regulator [Lentisphaerota bacterium]
MTTLDDCPCSGRTLEKLLAPAVLAQLAAGELHGYELTQRLAGSPLLAGKKPDNTGVYRLLRDMEARGLVTASWETDKGGPAKRRYALTADGWRCLEQWQATLTGYVQAVQRLVRAIGHTIRKRED